MADLALARDPKTPPAVLARLAEEPVPGLQRAVATNPSTPVEALITLARRWPRCVAANPSWPLLAIEHPGVWSALGRAVLTRLAQSPHGPLLVAWVAAEPSPADELLIALCRNPAVSQAERQQVLEQDLERTRRVLAALADPVEALGRSWLATWRKAGLRLHGKWAAPTCSPERLEALARRAPLGRELAFRARQCPPALFLELLQDFDWDAPRGHSLARQVPALTLALARSDVAAHRAAMATSPHLPSEFVQAFARDPSAEVRAALCQRWPLASDLIALLAGNAADEVASAVARRSGVSVALRRALLPREATHEALAQAPDLQLDLLWALARSKSHVVRRCVTARRRLPAPVLAALSRDHRSEEVLEVLGRTHGPRLLALGLADLGSPPALLRGAARHPQTPVAWLERLSRHDRHTVRVAVIVGACPRLDPEEVGRLVAPPRARPVRGGCLGTDWMRALAVDPDDDVRRALAYRSHSLSPDLLDLLARDAWGPVREALAQNTLDEATLLRLARDKSEDVRVELICARHRIEGFRFPTSVLEALKDDPSPLVQKHLERYLRPDPLQQPDDVPGP